MSARESPCAITSVTVHVFRIEYFNKRLYFHISQLPYIVVSIRLRDKMPKEKVAGRLH